MLRAVNQLNKVKVFEKEIGWIKNDKIREFAKLAVEGLPDYFFTVAASSTGKYHPEYALGNGGLTRHTKALLHIAKDLSTLEMFSKKYSDDDIDLIFTGGMCHDGIKHGTEYSKYTVVDHPVQAANYIRELNKKVGLLTEEQEEKLYGIIISHMGQWNTDRYKNEIMPKPKKSIESFVHLCDYLASRKYLLFDFGADYYNPEDYAE